MSNVSVTRKVIQYRTDKAWAMFAEFQALVKAIENDCEHPAKTISKRGHTDDLLEQHWAEYKCPDCRKEWKEDV